MKIPFSIQTYFLFPDDSDDDDLATSADRELFNKFRMGERRVSTVYRVVE